MFDFSKYFAMLHTTLSFPNNGPMIPTAKRTIQYDTSNVIEIRGAYKRYPPFNIVFQGLNMTVQKGTIYGLLGPSGCGKTTLLNCVTGLTSLDSGTITVHCSHRKQLGYMPQEAALMEKFKVSELLYYFGRIYGMQTETVKRRAKELLQLVNLPPDQFYSASVTSLSGGQLRRVSLLVALIHDPDLLILDEPTVGLDPVTRLSLWQYFLKATEEQNKTVIITTHYIEEARQSHKIGLIREGILLAEASPRQLLSDYKCMSLEAVFLLLSQDQSNRPMIKDKPYPKSNPPCQPFNRKDTLFNFDRMAAQVKKNFYWVRRNMSMMIYMLLLPGVMSFLFCTVYSNQLRGIHIAAVSEESCDQYNVTVTPKCSKQSRISCLYLQHMKDKGYIINEYKDLASGMSALKHGQSLVLLYFNRNYTCALMDLIWSSVTNPPTNETLDLSELQVTLDMTEMLKAGHIKTDIQDIFCDVRKEVFIDCGLNPSTVEDPIRVAKPIYGQKDPMFIHTAMPGFIVPFVFYLTTTYTSTAAATEKTSGVLQRSLVSGLTKLEVMLAHSVIQLMVVAGQNCMMFLIMYVIYNNPMHGSVVLALTFIFISELQGMLYGFFLASRINQETHITYTAIGTILALFLTSGMFWPMEGMVKTLRNIVYYSPWARAVEGYRSISIRGWGLEHPSVSNALVYNIATIFILVVANVVSSTTNNHF